MLHVDRFSVANSTDLVGELESFVRLDKVGNTACITTIHSIREGISKPFEIVLLACLKVRTLLSRKWVRAFEPISI